MYIVWIMIIGQGNLQSEIVNSWDLRFLDLQILPERVYLMNSYN